MMNLKFRLLLVTMLTGMSAAWVHAQELYKWVDEQGVTHYGDTLPEQATPHHAFEFTEYQQPTASDTDYFSVQNQLQRLQNRRTQDLKQKQQRAEINAAKNPPQQEIVFVPQEPQRRYYSPAYLPHGFNRTHAKGVAPYYDSYVKHHSKQPRVKQDSGERSRGGIVWNANKKPSKAVYSASK